MTNSEETFSNEQSSKSFQQKLIKGFKITIAVGGIALWGIGFYKGEQQAARGQTVYNEYENNFQVHVERASTAGTVAVATEELAQAMPWLEENYSQDSFEYRNLKAGLQYLQKQKPELLVPDSIQNSIQQTNKTIEQTQLVKLGNSSSLSILLIAFTVFTILLISAVVALLNLGEL